jgi:hypothetical protein
VTALVQCQQQTNNCSSRGYCDGDTGQCVCDSGPYWAYTGSSCSQWTITSGETCQNGGTWVEGLAPPLAPFCQCSSARYGGLHCEVDFCPLSTVGGAGQVCGGVGTCQLNATSFLADQRSSPDRPTCSCPTNPQGSQVLYPYAGQACEYNLFAQPACIDPLGGLCNSGNFGQSGTCVPLYNNSAPIPQKYGKCICPSNRLAPDCYYSVCDNPSLGTSKHDCNKNGNSHNFCNVSTNACACSPTADSGERLWAGAYCENDVTAQCGLFSSASSKWTACDNNGVCAKNSSNQYSCACNYGWMDSLCHNKNCSSPCIHGQCVPGVGGSTQYTCQCQPIWSYSPNQNHAGSGQNLPCIYPISDCANAVPLPDGSQCYCNNTLYKKPSCAAPNYACPGTNIFNSLVSQCGPDFQFYQTDGSNFITSAGTTQMPTDIGQPQIVKACHADTGICTCTGPYTNAADGSCTTPWNLNRTVSLSIKWNALTQTGTVTAAKCSSLYTTQSFCNSPQCVNGGVLSGSACQCPAGYTGSACEQDLCQLPRGQRTLNGSCACNGTYYWGSYCQYSSCANNGTWDSTALQCRCPQAWTGSNCTVSTCGALGRPVASTGLCNCSVNSTFQSGSGCDPNPQPVCLNGGVAANYSCRCPLGFVGALCQTPLCGSNAVFNRSTGLCDCLGLWQHNANDNYNCTWSSCHPGGVPAALPNLLCVCSQPYVITVVDQSHCVLTCLNGGIYSPERAACSCASGWQGTTCTTQVPYALNQTDTGFLNATVPLPVIQNNATVGNSTSGGNTTLGTGGDNCRV